MASFVTPASGGGTPGGSNTQLQFNDSSVFGGASYASYDKTTNKCTFTGTNGQTGNLLEIKKSTGDSLVYVRPDGSNSPAGTLCVDSTQSSNNGIRISNSNASVGNKKWLMGVGNGNAGLNGGLSVWYDTSGNDLWALRFSVDTDGTLGFFGDLRGKDSDTFKLLSRATASGAGKQMTGTGLRPDPGGIKWTSGEGSIFAVGTVDNVTSSGTFNPASGNAKINGLKVDMEIAQTGTASGDYTAIGTNVTETAFLGTNGRLLDLKVGGSSKFIVDRNGYATGAGSLRDLGYTSSTADPTTTELPSNKDVAIHKNTTSGAVYLAYNDGGAIKKVALT